MKIIYKSLMTIAFAGLSLASCDKELKAVSYTHLTLPTTERV